MIRSRRPVWIAAVLAATAWASAAVGADGKSVLLVLGEDEYKTQETVPAFAKRELEPRGFRVTVVTPAAGDRNSFPGLVEGVRSADLVVVSVHRRTPPKDQLDALKAHVAAGKPLVGLRTASHAFSLRGNKPAPPGSAAWPEFDAAVLGGHYTGHHSGEVKVAVSLAPGADGHPVLRGIDPAKFGSRKLYKSDPVAGSATPLLVGTIPGKKPEPVAWTNRPPEGKGRVFYTSLGHPDDFETAAFRRLLLNGIYWAVNLPAPADGGE